MTRSDQSSLEAEVTVHGLASGFVQTVHAESHILVVDQPKAYGGDGTGVSPYDLLLAALGS